MSGAGSGWSRPSARDGSLQRSKPANPRIVPPETPNPFYEFRYKEAARTLMLDSRLYRLEGVGSEADLSVLKELWGCDEAGLEARLAELDERVEVMEWGVPREREAEVERLLGPEGPPLADLL